MKNNNNQSMANQPALVIFMDIVFEKTTNFKIESLSTGKIPCL